LIEYDRLELFERPDRILQCIERERGFVLGKAVAVRELGVLLLQVPGIGQQDPAKVLGRRGAEDRA
jgi:hypothetical protein